MFTIHVIYYKQLVLYLQQTKELLSVGFLCTLFTVFRNLPAYFAFNAETCELFPNRFQDLCSGLMHFIEMLHFCSSVYM